MEAVNVKVFARLKAKFTDADIGSKWISRRVDNRNSPKEKIVESVRFLKDDDELCFNLLADLCGNRIWIHRWIDFGIIYKFVFFHEQTPDSVKDLCGKKNNPKLPTVDRRVGNWQTGTLNVSTFDMFGIIFEGHPDLRRMYTAQMNWWW